MQIFQIDTTPQLAGDDLPSVARSRALQEVLERQMADELTIDERQRIEGALENLRAFLTASRLDHA